MTGELLAGAVTAAPQAAARQPFEQYIRRFDRSYRHRLRKLKGASPRLGDLLYTFPGAAVAIAAGQRPAAQRQEAKRLAAQGRTLKQVAETLGLPMWLKNLPPEAFTRRLGDLPAGSDFTRRIANCLPGSPGASAMWLRWVAFGSEVCDERFALWLAQQRLYGSDPASKLPLLPLAAFAWFSSRRGALAGNLMRRPWSPHMTFEAALDETQAWLDEVLLDYCCVWLRNGGGWRREGYSGGYRLVPLLSRRKLEEEGVRMGNCVAAYVRKVVEGRCLIYSIRRGERRVATLEIVLGRWGVPVINQLLGPGNVRAPGDVWQAVRNWVSRRGGCPLKQRASRKGSGPDAIIEERWNAVWKPFWDERPQFEAVLRSPEAGAARLRRDLTALRGQ